MQLLEHFKELTVHPKNAEQLKGLILQLAIQGKLTKKWREQNPNIESASVLLEKIKEEKAQLIKEKKIKKEKALPEITKEEMPFELPEGWVVEKLGNVGFTQTGSTPAKKDPENYGNYIPFLGPADISNLTINYPEEGLSDVGLSNGRLIPSNSLMMVCIGGSIGKCNINKIDVSCNQQINTITPICSPVQYIKIVCQSSYFQKEVTNKATGSATPIINKGKWENIIIPVPPLAEQKAIVAIVNQLFAEVDQLEAQTKARVQLKNDFVTSALKKLAEAQEVNGEWLLLQQHFKTFFNTREAVKKLRETILQLAVQGKLTHHWRSTKTLLSSPPFKEEYPKGEVVVNKSTSKEVDNTLTSKEVINKSISNEVDNKSTSKEVVNKPISKEVDNTLTSEVSTVEKNLSNLPYLKTFRKELRNNLTPAEAAFWKLVQNKKLEGRKFRRQHSVANYILDFYCPSEKLAIELDGQGHFEASQAEYDYERDLFLKHCGIKVLRFENKEVFENTEAVLAHIKEHFGREQKQPPRPADTPPCDGEQKQPPRPADTPPCDGDQKQPPRPADTPPCNGDQKQPPRPADTPPCNGDQKQPPRPADTPPCKGEQKQPPRPADTPPCEGGEQGVAYIEHAAVLLDKIKAEKAQLIKEKKIKKEKPLPEITAEEIPYELPEGWVWCRLGKLIKEKPRNGYSPKGVEYETQTKSLKLGATTKGKFDSSQVKYLLEMIPSDSYLRLKKNDILIQRSNSIEYVGVSAIYDGDDFEFVYPDLMMKLQACSPINTYYLHTALSSNIVRSYFRNNASGTSGNMPKINQTIVVNTLIPICSEEEQKAIVSKVNRLMALCDQLEQEIAQNTQQVEDLMQSCLREAFEE
jgi:restriction endonuclease S subunit/very-short-patch-repair endonuclease